MEKFGSRFMDTISLCLCASFFSFLWPLESWYIVTSMNSVHNATHFINEQSSS
jgi:hypothetical protein